MMDMILALVGSGEYLPPVEALDRYLLELIGRPPRVVCLPTAAGSESPQRLAYWRELGLAHFTRLGVPVESLPVIDTASANNARLADQIRQANFVYLSGGNPNYLYKTLKDSLAWAAILETLGEGGVIAGCSAGAMIMGERIPGIPVSSPAFNLLPGTVILPHFDEMPRRVVQMARPLIGKNMTLVGIEGSTALIRVDGRLEVVGRGGVLLWNQRQKERYLQGQEVHFVI